jgi:hypothetical protein
MRAAFGLVTVAAVLLSATAPALAQKSDRWIGEWASEPAACRTAPGPAGPLIATRGALRWGASVCRIGKIYKIGDTAHIEARCWSGGRSRAVPVTLAARGDRLAASWDGAALKEMRRCR